MYVQRPRGQVNITVQYMNNEHISRISNFSLYKGKVFNGNSLYVFLIYLK
jgi:hypothetical protein